MRGAMDSFREIALLSSLQTTIESQGLVSPTDIQARVIPALLAGRSVVGVAETGSGKTLAYALPILHLLKTIEASEPTSSPSAPRAVVIVPTRELGEQVAKVFKIFTHETRLRVRTLLGGMKVDAARRNVQGPFEVLVATPGRLGQFVERELVRLSDVRLAVLDEADQLLDLGFLSESKKLIRACRADCQLALFSATIPPAVEALIQSAFHDPLVIRTEGSHKTVASLVTRNVNVVRGRRFEALQQILAQNLSGGTLVFANTRDQCDALVAQLRAAGRACLVYRGEMDKVERKKNLRAFRDGEIDLLVATDLGSRGLDIEQVARVVNYHLPESMQNYLHRVGRTARAGRTGLVINLVTARDRRLVSQLEGMKPYGGSSRHR
jgi:ATP-dependent RNA helicase RhlE